ncbi:DUF11 domain-containing protein [Deinococcus sp. Marseille-Q6407]|uniref:DUF11 domain-containing protein n=1 Tax=Deinococcus sp. Marseille-Q6407 TaxID=2969223 RepID=UPI0021C00079|nr:DUF11 domain-containing protein [Deinococcus sp. Marseille-Q6407]
MTIKRTGALLALTALLAAPAQAQQPSGVGQPATPRPADAAGHPEHPDILASLTTVTGGGYRPPLQLPVEAAPSGSEVKVSPIVVPATASSTTTAPAAAQPQVGLSLDLDKPQVCVGDVVKVQAQGLTASQEALPLDLQVQAPGLQLSGQGSLTGQVSAAQPAWLSLEALATQPGTYAVTLTSPRWNQTVTRQVQVLAAETGVQMRREVPQDLEAGQESTVRVLLTNRSPAATSYDLSEEASGLELLDSGTFQGQLAPGETRELSYRVRALASGTGGQTGQITGRLTAGSCAVSQTSSTPLKVRAPQPPAAPQPQATVQEPTPTVQAQPVPVQEQPDQTQPAQEQAVQEQPAPAPEVPLTRTSEVQLPFTAPAQAQSLIVSHRLPEGATYQPGSARLNGQPLADPLAGASGLLYWDIPASTRGQLSYTVSHQGALPALAPASLVARYPGDRREILEGQFGAEDFRDARPLQAQEAAQENSGAVRLPLAGTVYRTRDKISVTVEKPQGDNRPLLINSETVPDDQIGTNTQDGIRRIQRLTYVGVQLRPGPNVLRQGDDEVTVVLASQTAQVKVEPLQLLADGSTPLRVRIMALDQFGTPTSQPTLTLNSNLEPLVPDASAAVTGYQLRLKEGVGVLELRPQTVPSELQLELDVGGQVQTQRFQVRPDQRRFGVGLVTATVGLNPQTFSPQKDLLWTGRGYFEGPVGEGKLFVAADRDALPYDLDPFERFPMAGDASVHSVPLQGIDPVAAVYDHPRFRVGYRRTALPITALPLGETLTAATLETRSNPSFKAFAAYVPSDQVRLRGAEALVPDGLRILRLPDTAISRGSESLELVVLERGTGLELRREPLVRYGDYSIDYSTGVITLDRELQPLDEDFNDVRVEASYRLDNPLQNREWAYGAEASAQGRFWTAGVAAVQLPTQEGARQSTVGARVQYDNRENLKAEARAAYSAGVQAGLDVTSRPRESDRATLRVRYQDTGYNGLGKASSGFSLRGTYQARFTAALSGELETDYRNDFAGSSQGYVRGVADYRLQPFTVGGGLKYSFGDVTGLSAVARAGYTGDPVSVGIEHEQGFTGDVPAVTNLRASYKLSDTMTLKAQDRFTWGAGHQALLGVDSRLGNTNFSVGYELPTASGDGNRARFGVKTSLPLNKRTTLGLRGSTVYNVAGRYLDAAAGADLQYKGQGYVATAGGDIGYNGQDGEWRSALRGGVSGNLTDELTLTADALAEFRTSGTGQRLTLGYGYRGSHLSSLGYARYVNGTLAGGNPALTSGVVAEYRQPNWAVRAGNDTRWLLDDRATFSGQAFVGGNYYPTERFGVGAWGRTFYQPADLPRALYGYGVEANLRALPGTWLSAGYNFAGFDGLPSGYTYTRPGAYLRLDLTLDDTIGGRE